MDLQEYLKQENSIRTNVHYHDGIFWKRTAPQCCQPLYPLQEIAPGIAKPSRLRSMVRYSHLVPNGIDGNLLWSCHILDEIKLKCFSFEKLKHEKRKAINRGENSGLSVRRITDLADYWTDLKAIYISTAARTSYGLDSSHYEKYEKAWKENLQNEFLLLGRDWYGVFYENKIIGFLYSCLIDDTAYLLVTKFNNEYGNMRPSDYLHYHVISYYRDLPQCNRIFAGRSITTVPNINRFKESFGFEQIKLPAFQNSNQFIIRAAKKILAFGRFIVEKVPFDFPQPLQKKLGALNDAVTNLDKVSD